MAEAVYNVPLPERPIHSPLTRNLQVTTMPAITTGATHPMFSRSGSRTSTKASTSNQEITALNAATFILTMTNSLAARGRTATNEGTDKSDNHKSGFEKALPTGNARMIGIARVVTRIR